MDTTTNQIAAVAPAQPLAFSTDDAAKLLGVSAKTLANWRCLGKGPAYIRLGNSPRAQVLYRYEDLNVWLSSLSRGDMKMHVQRVV